MHEFIIADHESEDDRKEEGERGNYDRGIAIPPDKWTKNT